MGQAEVYDLLLKHPRLFSTEIANKLGWSIVRVCHILEKMKSDLLEEIPTEEEIDRILKNFPERKHTINGMKVYIAKNE